jgi:hypothetical protein
MAKWLILAGVVLIGLGVLVLLLNKLGIPLGRLPGDIRWEGENGAFYFPLTTSIIISIILSLIVMLVKR